MKKILHIVGIMNLGGQETLIMNVFRKINRKEYQFDFVVQRSDKGYYDDEIKKLGGNIFYVEPVSKNPFKHIYQLNKILKNNNYCAFHRHTNSSIVFIDIIIAKFNKIKNIIVHCHSTKTNINSIIHTIFKPILNIFNIKRVACSKDAGIFMFGNNQFKVINNGIEIKNYLFNESVRNIIRKKYNISNECIIGHVGRFNNEKNHPFIINMFCQLLKYRNDFKLFLIGDGDNRKYIEKLVYEKKIQDKVVFLGNVNNVYDYLQAIDVFVFPSIYEGLGISLIEAQASSLNCLVSNSIPNEALLTNNVKVLSLDNIENWVKEIIKLSNYSKNRKVIGKKSKVYEFDIDKTIEEFCDLYKGDEE